MRRSRRAVVLVSAVAVSAALPGSPALAAPPDRTPPTLQVTGVSNPTFYPVRDGFKDLVKVTYAVSDDSADTTLRRQVQITDGQGAVVLDRATDVATPGTHSFSWDGRTASGALNPKGDYTVTLTVTDSAGNVSTPRSRVVTLSPKRIVDRTFRTTVSATWSAFDRDVGRCATLRKPSLRGWAGSLGYYSNTRCRATGVASMAATTNGVYVPRAFRGRYGDLRINVYGGAARTRPSSSAALDYWNAKRDAWVARKFMGSAVRTHSGRRVGARPLVHPNPEGRPIVVWDFLTAAGDRFDVKTFTVVLRYQLLR
jgi:FlgD Ig-like domain